MNDSNGKPPIGGGPPRQWVAQMFMKLESALIAYVFRRLGNRESSQDVVQEAFVKLCQQKWPEIEVHAKAWLYKTCRNRAIDITRREGRMNTLQSSKDVATLHDRSGNQPDRSALQDEQMKQVRAQLESLPERQQELLRLRLHEGLSYKQIAEVTGLTVTNVGYLLHQAIAGLRGRLQVD